MGDASETNAELIYGKTKANPGCIGDNFTFAVWEEMTRDEHNPLKIWMRYRQESERFLATLAQGGPENRQKIAEMVSLAVIEEVGEICGHLKKVLFQGHPFDSQFVLKELGDICWYLARNKTHFSQAFFEVTSPSFLSARNLRGVMSSAVGRDYSAVLNRILAIGESLGFSLIAILGHNLVKLHHRYPTGAFRTKDSVNRKESDR